MEEETESTRVCGHCLNVVSEPFLICQDCPDKVILCLHCFARGSEFASHQSDHAYSIIRKDYSLFESHWTAEEEIDLLAALSDCGYGNWSDVSQRLKGKTKQECERHYKKCYINDPQPPLEKMEDKVLEVHPQPLVFKLSDDPPRYPGHSIPSQEMGGYMAARGDFSTEFNNFQELDVIHMSFDDNDEEEKEELEENVKICCLEAFWEGLKERHRRKKIIRDFGLINLSKVFMTNKRYDKTLREFIDKIRPFIHLMTPLEYDKYIEGLHLERELRNQIMFLQEYRQNGITKLGKVKMFRFLKQRRLETKSKIHMLDDFLQHVNSEKACQLWLQKQALLGNLTKSGLSSNLPNVQRKSAPPLDIIGLPGYDKLSDEEKEVCASVRLVPDAFFEFKNALTNENKKNGFLKLGQARSLIKIDVNKTRRLYDYLMSKGLINKDPLT